MPSDLDDQEWCSELDVLLDLLKGGDDDRLWDWFQSHFPECMGLVPTRRRDQFIEGVREAYRDDDDVRDLRWWHLIAPDSKVR